MSDGYKTVRLDGVVGETPDRSGLPAQAYVHTGMAVWIILQRFLPRHKGITKIVYKEGKWEPLLLNLEDREN
ncbi:hypothetical protein LshimejAT787_1602530 [Lyophyllum shimeji]|uniref:Uncharacterized protein n=1 Tax=Lyophyllum shimeji TaxID=47721 RepID=A0A9P3PYE6_LYOSH|nr:hypothetical protein LshimejAT787_1602530 [Lyophyllum shimeji]